MRRRSVVAVLATFTMLAGLAASVAPVGAHTASSAELDKITRRIQELQSKLKEAKSERSVTAQQLAAQYARVKAAQAKVDEAQANVDAVQAEYDAKEQQRLELQHQLDTIRAELDATERNLAATKVKVDSQAVTMYMNASASLGTFVLGLNDASQLAIGLAYADDVLGEGVSAIDSLAALRKEEDRQRAALTSKTRDLQKVLDDLEVQKRSLATDLQKLEAAKADAEADLHSAQDLLASIDKQIRDYQAGIEYNQAEKDRVTAAIAAAASGAGTKPGILAWPIRGIITSDFGVRVHPITNRRSRHDGIDIGAPMGAPIRAAGAGRVILSQWFGGYGLTIVIDHGGGLTTLYAHQSKLAASVGQTVQIGQVIGYIGSTGNSTGPHLHFETREGSTPVNPLKYLQG